MAAFASIDDIITLWRQLKPDEVDKATKLLDVVSDSLRYEAMKVSKNLDEMAAESAVYSNVLKSVTVDVIARTLMTATDQEPMMQSSESALGYSFSGTYLVPGGGLFIKRSELARLGLRRQRIGIIETYGLITEATEENAT